MSNRAVTIEVDFGSRIYPPGTKGGNTRVTITGAALTDPVIAEGSGSSFGFTLAEDPAPLPDYSVEITLLDTDGNPLGDPLTGTFSVIEPPAVDIPTPSNFRVMVGDVVPDVPLTAAAKAAAAAAAARPK